LNENEKDGNDYCFVDGDHGDLWHPFLAEMSSEEVQRNVEKRMNGGHELQIVQPPNVTGGAADLN
jgi:hypothetical protein